MYYPYLRGKQYELILLREQANFLSNSNIHPIIEPVKLNTTTLRKTLTVLKQSGVEHTLIVNPQVGEYCNEGILPSEFLDEVFIGNEYVFCGIVLHADSDIDEIHDLLMRMGNFRISLIHYGYSNSKELIKTLEDTNNITSHIFIGERTSKIYRKQFKHSGIKMILIRDGFRTRKKNSEYPPTEHFSELHLTFSEEGAAGFGDFLIVGDEFRESGGPAYAVAIHLTYIDSNKYDDMFIHHFISDQKDSPINPGGKFLEALSKLVEERKKPDSNILETDAVREYLSLYEKKHYPGLGYVKKLSMKHHIELMVHTLKEMDL